MKANNRAPKEIPVYPIILAIHIGVWIGLSAIFGRSLASKIESSLRPLLDENNAYRRLLTGQALRLANRDPEMANSCVTKAGRGLVAGGIAEFVYSYYSNNLNKAARAKCRRSAREFLRGFEESLEGAQGDGLPNFGGVLDIPLETVLKDPRRVRSAFPPQRLGLSARERKRLEDDIGGRLSTPRNPDEVDSFAYEILNLLVRLDNHPGEIPSPGLRRNHVVWKLAGMKKPAPGRSTSMRKLGAGSGRLLRLLGTKDRRERIARMQVGRWLRAEFGLSRHRNTQVGLPSEERTEMSSLTTQSDYEGEIGPEEVGASPT